MFALDLFNTRYERDLREGAVDDLEARRIDDLNAKMDDLLARAREAKTPEHKAGLKREFEKVKNERDSYFKIKEQQTPSNIPPANKGIGDLQDPKQKMAQLQQKAKKGPLANVGAGLKAFLTGKEEPMDEQVDQTSSGPRAYGVANFQRLVKANMGNIPTVTLEFAKPEDNIKLDQAGVDLISDYYDGLDSDQAKNHFIYRVLPSADEVRTVLKQLGWNSQIQQPLPGIPTQGELPLAEKKKFDNSSDLEAGDVKVARELQKLRAQYPAAKSDVEAVARAEIDSSERSQQQLSAIKGANEKQDALLKQLVSLDQEQGREIDDLDQENNTLEKRLAQVQSTNDRLQQAIGQMTGTKKSDSKTNQTKTNKSSTDNTDDVNDKVAPVAEPAPKEKPKSTPKVTPKPEKVNAKSAAIDSMARQITGFNQPAPELDATVSDKETDSDNDRDVIQRPSKLRALRPTQATNADEFKLTAESDIREQSNDDDWYDDEDQETELRSGDYVRDTMDGESGEIFRMQGDPEERRVRILDRDGKGWYIEPGRLVVVDRNDPDIQRYFGKRRVRDMDESNNPKLAAVIKNIQARVPQAAIKRPEIMQRVAQMVKQADPTVQDAMVTAQQLVQQYGQGAPEPKATNVNDLKAQARSGNVMAQLPKTSAGTPTYAQQHATFEQGVAETALNSKNPQGDYQAKRKALQDLSMNKDVDQKAVQQRKLDLDREAKAKGVTEGLKSGEYHVHTVYFKDGTKKRVRVTSDEFDVADYYTKRGQAVDHVDYDFQIHSDMTEAEKEPTTRQELLNRVDKIQRMMSQERNPANLQILRKELEMLKQRYQHLREDNDSAAVEQAILRRIMVAHIDLLKQFGPDKVMQAAEEVAYNVGDVDEIGTSDVSAYVAQVKQILGVPEELDEKWSQKYKSSINCASPKGFSQRAHCAGKKK